MNAKQFGALVRLALSAILVSLMLVGAAGHASASPVVIYVKANAAGAHNGTSWANAYRSLQVALAHVTSGEQIWVAKGTYKPSTTGNRSDSFHLVNGVGIFGGFAGTETLLKQRRPAVNKTILSGEIGAAGYADNSYHVVTSSGTNSTAVLNGFWITAGNTNGASAPDDSGGGVYNDAGSPTLRNVTFSKNDALNFGGGMYNLNGSHPALNGGLFTGNKAAHGGGMSNDSSDPVLTRIRFAGNHASVSGGGIENVGSNPTLTNVVFTGDSATSLGGGVANLANSSPVMQTMAFTTNSAASGGGLYNENGSAPTVTNVTFAANTATNGGGMYDSNASPVLLNVTFGTNSATNAGAVYDAAGSTSLLNDVIAWGNGASPVVESSSTTTIQDSIVEGGCPGGASCTNVKQLNPVLQPLQNYGAYPRAMALGAGSAAIDAGGVATTCAARDQRGVTRPQGAACDIGAYEVRALTFRSAAAYDGFVRESTQTSGVGLTVFSNLSTLHVGDDFMDRQFRGFLSFDTSSIPDSARVVPRECCSRIKARSASTRSRRTENC